MYRRLPPSVTLAQAADGSPTLARLSELARESNQRLETVLTLIPQVLRNAVKAGPVAGDSWCLLVESPAAAAKLRQLIPALQARLREQGCTVDTIRVKVQGGSRT
jgi:hypothetical protein